MGTLQWLQLVTGAAFILAGLVAWRARPGYKLEGAQTDFLGWVASLTLLALLINFLRARLARTQVGRLLVDLRDDSDPARLRGALGDPGLGIAFRVPEYDTHTDLDGNEVELPEEDEAVAITLLARGGGTRVAVLLHDPSLREEGDLLPDVTEADNPCASS